MLLMTWERRPMVDCWSPSIAIEIASSSVVRDTEAENAFTTVIEYSLAFAEYLETARVLKGKVYRCRWRYYLICRRVASLLKCKFELLIEHPLRHMTVALNLGNE
jgi:hypothetical protein